MSHIVTIATKVTDPEAVKSACRRLNLEAPIFGEHRMFDGRATGWAVRLSNWTYPVVCDTATGAVRYDNYGGRWGDTAQLDGFMQAYAAEKAKMEARKKGYTCQEAKQPDGSIRLTIHAGA